jgi:hypothetical protein
MPKAVFTGLYWLFIELLMSVAAQVFLRCRYGVVH